MVFERLIKIINARLPRHGAFTLLEEQTGISARAWAHVWHGRTKPSADHLEQICGLFPEYTLWLMTGRTAPEAGQTSPDLEQLEALKKSVEL
ncbi:DNA-binding protein [Azoarcus sp. TTM-91]|uniref:DNA-binding protein n=1 Tax=Azoarcus sp. TTM-91 TaxID=2691581 RepID=UPI00145DE608|nr:DNA-binding protein [Azoarcus sp. TTM-91]NMG35947.1 DNA-binding protein [Azoarcus sp. TTM-91]